MDESERAQLIKETREEMHKCNDELIRLIRECPHDGLNGREGGYCYTCGAKIEWPCWKSESKKCEYPNAIQDEHETNEQFYKRVLCKNCGRPLDRS